MPYFFPIRIRRKGFLALGDFHASPNLQLALRETSTLIAVVCDSQLPLQPSLPKDIPTLLPILTPSDDTFWATC